VLELATVVCQMHVRLLRRFDLPIAAELVRQLGYDVHPSEMAERIGLVLVNDTHYAAVADNGETVLGLVHAYTRPALEKAFEVVVQSLVVDCQARKSGIGKLLMAAAESWARSKGAKHVVLHTRVDRNDARAFYERIGYTTIATSHLMSKSIVAS
jgi:ribosomal protein S18 acetylase RimI-like enzyme